MYYTFKELNQDVNYFIKKVRIFAPFSTLNRCTVHEFIRSECCENIKMFATQCKTITCIICKMSAAL